MSRKFLLQIGAVLLVMTVAAAAFAGCKNKTADINSFADASTASGQPSQQSSAERKAQYKKALDPLVKDSTITQAQEDKILTLLTSGSGFGGMRSGSRPSGSRPAGSMPGGGNWQQGGSMPQGNWQQGGSMPQGGASGGTSSGRRFGSFSPLSSLVSSGTITQAQADKVMKAVSSLFTGRRSESSSQS